MIFCTSDPGILAKVCSYRAHKVYSSAPATEPDTAALPGQSLEASLAAIASPMPPAAASVPLRVRRLGADGAREPLTLDPAALASPVDLVITDSPARRLSRRSSLVSPEFAATGSPHSAPRPFLSVFLPPQSPLPVQQVFVHPVTQLAMYEDNACYFFDEPFADNTSVVDAAEWLPAAQPPAADASAPSPAASAAHPVRRWVIGRAVWFS